MNWKFWQRRPKTWADLGIAAEDIKKGSVVCVAIDGQCYASGAAQSVDDVINVTPIDKKTTALPTLEAAAKSVQEITEIETAAAFAARAKGRSRNATHIFLDLLGCPIRLCDWKEVDRNRLVKVNTDLEVGFSKLNCAHCISAHKGERQSMLEHYTHLVW